MTRVIAVANQKGGVAKTTTVASLGVALSELGRRVLLVDLDAQACLTFSLGLDPEALELSVHDVMLGRVSVGMALQTTVDGPEILPATIDLAGAEAAILHRTGREYILRNALLDHLEAAEAGGQPYDDVIIDCPPSLSQLTVNGLTAADFVLIPLQCETLSHRGVGQLLDTISDVRRICNRELKVMGVLPTMFDSRTALAKQVLNDIGARYGVSVIDPPIAKSVKFAEAPQSGRSALALAGRIPGVAAYRELARHLAEGTLKVRTFDAPAVAPDAPAASAGPAAPAAPAVRPATAAPRPISVPAPVGRLEPAPRLARPSPRPRTTAASAP